MKRNGTTSCGTQRWRCKACGASATHKINSDAKQLKTFLSWLFSKNAQTDMKGGGRTFRRKTSHFWSIWAMPPIIDEIHNVIYIDGIYISRKLVVLIASTDDFVLGWYLARSEHSKAWGALMSRIAPPEIVVTDGACGFEKARKQYWPNTEVQRCVLHAFRQVRRYTTSRPKLPAGIELYGLAQELKKLKTLKDADCWVSNYLNWCSQWDEFLEEKSYGEDGRWSYTHWRLRKARSSLNRIIGSNQIFTYLTSNLAKAISLPSTNNRAESINAQLRRMLRIHRGLSPIRRVKAVFWWCYMHTEYPKNEAEILKDMPTDEKIDKIYRTLTEQRQRFDSIPQWGDAIVWSELHTSEPWRHDWD